MYKSNIYQKNIIFDSEEIEQVLLFDNSFVELTAKNLIIKKNGNILLNTDLKVYEEDFTTISYIGKFDNGISFRLVKPKDMALVQLKNKFNCELAFTIASVNPSDYAIHFILTKEGQKPNINEIEEKGRNEHIQRLIFGSMMALESNLQNLFVDFSKRLLKLITTTEELSTYNQANQIIKHMKENRRFYDANENMKIK